MDQGTFYRILRFLNRLESQEKINKTHIRSSLVSFEGRTATASQIARKTVLIKIEELTQSLFSSIMEKGPGAILILLPMEINQPSFPENVTQDQLNKVNS